MSVFGTALFAASRPGRPSMWTYLLRAIDNFGQSRDLEIVAPSEADESILFSAAGVPSPHPDFAMRYDGGHNSTLQTMPSSPEADGFSGLPMPSSPSSNSTSSNVEDSASISETRQDGAGLRTRLPTPRKLRALLPTNRRARLSRRSDPEVPTGTLFEDNWPSQPHDAVTTSGSSSASSTNETSGGTSTIDIVNTTSGQSPGHGRPLTKRALQKRRLAQLQAKARQRPLDAAERWDVADYTMSIRGI